MRRVLLGIRAPGAVRVAIRRRGRTRVRHSPQASSGFRARTRGSRPERRNRLLQGVTRLIGRSRGARRPPAGRRTAAAPRGSALDALPEPARRTDGRQAEQPGREPTTDWTVDAASPPPGRLGAGAAGSDAALAALDIRLVQAVRRAPSAKPIGDRTLDDGAVAAPGAAVVTVLQEGPPPLRPRHDPALADMPTVSDLVRMQVGKRSPRPPRAGRTRTRGGHPSPSTLLPEGRSSAPPSARPARYRSRFRSTFPHPAPRCPWRRSGRGPA